MEEEAESTKSLATEKTEGNPIPSEVSGSTDSTLEQVPAIVSELIDLVAAINLPVDVHKCMTKASLQLQCDLRGTTEPQVHRSRCSWPMNYTVLSFMMNGDLYAEYNKLAGMLELPHCSNQQWPRIVGKLEEKVTELAEWSCCKVRETIKQKHTFVRYYTHH